MKYCPNCRHELTEGVTRCHNKDCGLEFLQPNIRDESAYPPVKSERLKELELEYTLADRGLGKGMHATYAAMASGGFTLLAALVAAVAFGVTVLTGGQLVTIFAILAIAIILFFALVFGRAAKVKAELSKEKQRLEVELGRTVRGNSGTEGAEGTGPPDADN